VEVVERFVQGRSGDADVCEDRIHVTATHAAVIDGASLPGTQVNQSTGGIFAAEILASAIDELPKDTAGREAVDKLSEALDSRLHSRIGQVHKGRRPRCVAVIFAAARREIWRVGDCHFAIGDRLFPGYNPGEETVARFRQHLLGLLLRTGRATVDALLEHDPTGELIAPLVQDSYVLCNDDQDPFGFGAFDGTPVPDRFIEIYSVPPNCHQVVMASDGYPEASPTLALAEEEVMRIMRNDPLRIGEHASSKGIRPGDRFADDRAYLRLRL
jgi:hypothetical protein